MYRITENTQVTMPVCPSDWATNGFAPFGNEAKLRGRNIQEYIWRHFQRKCTFFKRNGELYVTFRARHIAHRELVFMRKAFFLDDRPHTFKEIGV